MPLSPLKLKKLFNKVLRVGHVYIEESFDTIFNMGYGEQRPPPMDYGPGKSAMNERVKKYGSYQLLYQHRREGT